MPLFLLLLGGLAALGGVALIGAGVAMRDAFNSDVVTPGTITAVGGLLLIGMGLTVRELQRVAQAVAGLPPIRDDRQGRGANVAYSANGAARLPFPPMPSLHFDLPVVPGPGAPVVEAANSRLAQRDTALTTAHTEPRSGGLGAAPVVFQAANGATAAPAIPRLSPKSDRPAAANGAAGRGFNGARQAKQRTDVTPLASQAPPPLPRAAMPVSASEERDSKIAALAQTASTDGAAAPVAALKSGIIEGMAYTLYSDGSIDAELPQGKLRFGSIRALRDHIEGAA